MCRTLIRAPAAPRLACMQMQNIWHREQSSCPLDLDSIDRQALRLSIKQSRVVTERRRLHARMRRVLRISAMGPAKSLCHHRLMLLEQKFRLHQQLNSDKEFLAQKSAPHRDFYNVRKVPPFPRARCAVLNNRLDCTCGSVAGLHVHQWSSPALVARCACQQLCSRHLQNPSSA